MMRTEISSFCLLRGAKGKYSLSNSVPSSPGRTKGGSKTISQLSNFSSLLSVQPEIKPKKNYDFLNKSCNFTF